jgi:hypothetical protein
MPAGRQEIKAMIKRIIVVYENLLQNGNLKKRYISVLQK